MTANKNAERIERLKQKYDPQPSTTACGCGPDDFLDKVEWRDRIDQHYTRSWLEFTYGGLFHAEEPRRANAICSSPIAQFLAMGELEEFERQIPSALAAGATRAKCSR